MSKRTQNLGKLVSIHGVSPASLQRAAVVAIVSFVFFFVMLMAFYIRQQIGYFILSSAFLVVNLFTLAGIWMQQRSTLKIYENGLSYKKLRSSWDRIADITETADGTVTVSTLDGSTVNIDQAIQGIGQIAAVIRSRIANP